MELDPAGGTPKRNRSKSKPAAAAEPATKAPRAKKAKPVETAGPVTVTSITTIAAPDESELLGMISIAAYYIAEQRNFAPGHELEDWLEAERQIRTLHT